METKYEHIISAIKNSASVQPPEDFTEKVMAAVSTRKVLQPGALYRMKMFFLKKRRLSLRIFTDNPGKFECAYYFVLAGMFNLIMFAILSRGFKTISGDEALSGWVVMQPVFAFISAVGLIVMGVLTLKKNRYLIKTVYAGIIVYTCFAVINGIALQFIFRFPVAVMAACVFTCCCTGIGWFLLVIIRKYIDTLKDGDILVTS